MDVGIDVGSNSSSGSSSSSSSSSSTWGGGPDNVITGKWGRSSNFARKDFNV